jgi:hypothetical protein
MKTVESGISQARNGDAKAFDLRGLLGECVKGNAAWLERVGGYVRTQVVAKPRPGELASAMPQSER